MTLYDRAAFAERGIELRFIQMRPIAYSQFNHPFVSHLSIIDVLMFNPVERVREYLSEYSFV
jgi:hypothetical protein